MSTNKIYQLTRVQLQQLCKQHRVCYDNLKLGEFTSIPSGFMFMLHVNHEHFCLYPPLMVLDVMFLISLRCIYSGIRYMPLIEKEIITKCEEKEFKRRYLEEHPTSLLYHYIEEGAFDEVVNELRM